MSFTEKDGWFMEINNQWKGIATSLKCQEILEDQKSKYQHIVVFRSETFGNVLLLDGVIQLTEKDECAYQEMISHPALFSHHNPERVLIVGGGDGGVLREVTKHSGIKEIVICEIDQMVIDFAKKYFPSVACSWDDPRVRLVCADASVFIKLEKNWNKFDVIICDSSDPVGPAQVLFEQPFYTAMHRALRPGGKVSTQAESMWLHLDLIKQLVVLANNIFENVGYLTTQIPTYPCGQIGLLQCSKANPDQSPTSFHDFKQPCRSPASDMVLKYYSPELHIAAYTLPVFIQKALVMAKQTGKEITAKGEKRKRDETNA